jgi:hypothetical protein
MAFISSCTRKNKRNAHRNGQCASKKTAGGLLQLNYLHEHAHLFNKFFNSLKKVDFGQNFEIARLFVKLLLHQVRDLGRLHRPDSHTHTHTHTHQENMCPQCTTHTYK